MKKHKIILSVILFTFCLCLTGCSKFYLNNSKTNVTTVEVGSKQYLDRILNVIYNNNLDIHEKELLSKYTKENIDGDHFYYYVFANNNIVRIDEFYNFVIYTNCKYYYLLSTMPTITSYDSALKYHVDCFNTWYFVYYELNDHVEDYEDYETEIDESIFDTYNVNWVNSNEDKIIKFIKIRSYQYFVTKYIDSNILEDEYFYVNFDYIKNIYQIDLEQQYKRPYRDNLDTLLFYTYYNEGSDLINLLNNSFINTEDVYNKIIETENYESYIDEYLSKVKVKDNVITFDVDDPSNIRTELDNCFEFDTLSNSLDFNRISLYNNFNQNENIIIGDYLEATEETEEEESDQ